MSSIKVYPRSTDATSSDDERSDLPDNLRLIDISSIRSKDDRYYQRLFRYRNGIYNGTINANNLPEGQGTFTGNNNEEHYSGSWSNGEYHEYGYRSQNTNSIIHLGQFQDGKIKQGYGQVKLADGYEYDGKINGEKFHGLGSLAIQVAGLRDRDQMNRDKGMLKLVGEWHEGRIEKESIYLNEIEKYYRHQYEIFSRSLEGFLSSHKDDLPKQREIFQMLFDLLDKRSSNLNFLKEIQSDLRLPKEFKSSAELLFKLDACYNNLVTYTQIELNQTYKDRAENICRKELQFYVRRLAWCESENQPECISAREIFEGSFNRFLNHPDFAEVKKVLAINPLVVDLIRKLIRFANGRLVQVVSKYRANFFSVHKAFLRNLWEKYFPNVEFDRMTNAVEQQDEAKYQFYSDCYSNLLELPLLVEVEIEVQLSIIVPNRRKIVVKINGEEMSSKETTNDSNRDLHVIVFDIVERRVKSEQTFLVNNQSKELIEFIKMIKREETFLCFKPFEASEWLNSDLLDLFQDSCRTTAQTLAQNTPWAFLTKKGSERCDESIASSGEITLRRSDHIQVNEHHLNEKIELIVHQSMMFALNHFKPWEKIDTQAWISYLNFAVDESTSTKELGDRLIRKMIEDAIKDIGLSDDLRSMINYYRESLLKNSTRNYQSVVKEMKKVLEYFLQITQLTAFDEQNSIQALQLTVVKNLIEGQQSITEMIEYFLNFNEEFARLTRTLYQHFPLDQHEGFYRQVSEILSSLTEILRSILQAEEDVQVNSSEILQKYNSNNLDAALQGAVSQGNLIDTNALLKLDANINAQALPSKETPLHVAIGRNDQGLILFLVERGANIHLKNQEHLSASDYARQHRIDLTRIRMNLDHFQNQMYALHKLVHFLGNLESLNMSWFVEKPSITPPDPMLFERVGKTNLYKVQDIKKARALLVHPSPHYVLEIVLELLKIIKTVKDNNRIFPSEMIRVRAELILAIGQSFNYFVDQVKYTSLIKFRHDSIKPFDDVIKEIQSFEKFCERLKKLELYFLYNRKLKEIDLERALNLFQEENENLIDRSKIKVAFDKYENVFREYFSQILDRKKSIRDITEKTAEQAQFDRAAIPTIIAGLAVILSLSVSDFLERTSDGDYRLKEKFEKNYLLQPHCIQILGVFMILDINGKNNSIPPNHLGEISTGQGKSWALALLAGYFSLNGYRVTVACYSNYLSARDEKDFKRNLAPFHFSTPIHYRTFKSMCEERLVDPESKKSIRDLARSIITGEGLTWRRGEEHSEEKSILLIDEVDIFFSKNFGEMYHLGLTVSNAIIAEIEKHIWQNLMQGVLDLAELKNSIGENFNQQIKEDPTLSILSKCGVLKKHIDDMLKHALEVYQDMQNKNLLKDKYQLIDQILHMKGSDGKFSSRLYIKYENSFYYLKLKYEKEQSFEQSQLRDDNFGYLMFSCGTISYSELPKTYQGIFGVSGSLKDLSSTERSILEHYQVKESSYYPSFFGRTKLVFDETTDFFVAEDEKAWREKIVMDTRKILAQDRSVLIFFESEQLLEKFSKTCSGDLGVDPFRITLNKTFDGQKEENANDEKIEKLIKDEYAGRYGKVTLLTKEFGRGVDFQAEKKVNERGGMHVIQTFFSADIKEEIQIKGRTARKDEPGSYQLVLCLEHLRQSLSELGNNRGLEDVTKTSTYAELTEVRKTTMDLFGKGKLDQIETHREIHSRTLSFLKKASRQCTETNREELIRDLDQLST